MEQDWEQHADRLAARALAAGDPTGWFEQLYAAGRAGAVAVPDEGDPGSGRWLAEFRAGGTG